MRNSKLRTIISLFAGAGLLSAQTPSAPPTSADKLEQLEVTYQTNLRERHRVIIQQYLTELRKAQAAAPDDVSEAAFAEEIARVNDISAEGGIVSLTQDTSVPQSIRGKKTENLLNSRGMSISLETQDAIPTPPADATHLSLGETSWRLPKVPAGTYDLVIEYVCPALPQDAHLYLDYAGEKIIRPLLETHTTADMTTFRVMRIARLVLKSDAVDQAFILRATSTSAPWFFLKRVIIAKNQ